MKSILIGSPIYQKPAILQAFLESLQRLHTWGLNIHYLFVDDNKEETSHKLLQTFKSTNPNVTLIPSNEDGEYIVDEITHKWQQKNLDKVTRFKNKMIERAIDEEMDYLFLIDSDIVLHPDTLLQLLQDEKDIVSNLFWTAWEKGSMPMPQVWLKDAYSFHHFKSNDLLTDDDIHKQTIAFIEQLKVPGVYKVGGLGACTLISRKALLKGVNFNDVYNVSFQGEDRHFCIRAVALGLELFVDTYYPAYHIYRMEDLEGLEAYKLSCATRKEDIQKAQIREVVTKGLEGLMGFAYDEPLNESFKAYFTKEAAENQWEQVQAQKEVMRTLQFVSKIKVEACEKIEEQPGGYLCHTIISMKGYRESVSFTQQLKCLCYVVKEEGYKIKSFQAEEQVPVSAPVLIRHVKEVPTLTLSMCVRDEEDRYLERMLRETRDLVQKVVIIDDGSKDHTPELCYDLLGDKLTLVRNVTPQGDNQAVLRYIQWQETIRTNPQWILALDADEILEERAKTVLPKLMKNREMDSYIFRIYDFWDDEVYYREDERWCRHMAFRPFLTRYQPNYTYKFNPLARNETRLPINLFQLGYAHTDLRIKHYGYMKEEDRIRKYKYYTKLDPEYNYMQESYYQAFLERDVKRVRWNEHHINA